MIAKKKTITYEDIGRHGLFVDDPGKFSKTPDYTEFDVVIKKIRNPKIHSLAFSFAKLIKENLPVDAPLKTAKEIDIIYSLSILAGLYDEVLGLNGEIYLKPKSIAYDKMDQTEHDKVIRALLRKTSELTGIPVFIIQDCYPEIFRESKKKT